jgi:hypothetical protein
MSYLPTPDSVAGRGLAYLATKPPGYRADGLELSKALGVPASSLSGCFNMSVNAGLVHKVSKDGGREIQWVLGPRPALPSLPDLPKRVPWVAPPPPPPPPAPEPAEEGSAQPDHLVDEAAIDQAADALLALTAPVQQHEAPQPAEAEEPDHFACALFNDGRLYLELGPDENMTLQVEQTRALVHYLERIGSVQ